MLYSQEVKYLIFFNHWDSSSNESYLKKNLKVYLIHFKELFFLTYQIQVKKYLLSKLNVGLSNFKTVIFLNNSYKHLNENANDSKVAKVNDFGNYFAAIISESIHQIT